MENQLRFGAACWQRPRGAVSSLQRTPKGPRAACPHSQEDTGALCPHPAGFLPASSSPPLLHPTPPLQKPSPKAGRRSGAPGLVAGGQAARLPAARFPALRQLREELGSPAPCLLPAPWRAPLQLGCLLARRAVCLGLLSKTWQGAHGEGLGSPKPLSAAAPSAEAVLGQRPPHAASVSPLQSSPLCVQVCCKLCYLAARLCFCSAPDFPASFCGRLQTSFPLPAAGTPIFAPCLRALPPPG